MLRWASHLGDEFTQNMRGVGLESKAAPHRYPQYLAQRATTF